MCNWCTKLKTQSDKEEERLQINMILNNRWQTGEIIGRGTYGEVCIVTDKSSPKLKKFVAKFEKLTDDNDTGRLPQEAHVLNLLHKRGFTKHLVDVYHTGLCQLNDRPAQYMIMTYLGPNLMKLKRMCPESKLSPACVAIVAAQTFEVTRYVHDVGFLHRDIKPDNLVAGRSGKKHEIYLIDFGLARQFKDARGQLFNKREKAPHRGTRAFMSINIHDGEEHSPRDDLWSVFYSLVYLRTGTLPWVYVKDDKENDLTGKAKKMVIPARWLQSVEFHYMALHDYLTSLHFDMMPDYGYISKIVGKLMTTLNVTEESPMDWERQSYVYKNLDKQQLVDLFKDSK